MRVAAVDIGTNSTRLLVAETTPDGFAEIDRITTVTGLGRGVDAAANLADDAIARTTGALAAYRRRTRELHVDRVEAVATAATRDAPNRDAFLTAAETSLGVRPVVISGRKEADLAFDGASSVAHDPDRALVVDIGGGSTEFVTPTGGHSADIGSVRLSEAVLPDRPASFEQLVTAAALAQESLSPLPVPGGQWERIGVAGTWTSLAAIALDLPAYDRAAVHRSVVSLAVIDRMIVWLAAKTVPETAAIPSLDPARAPVLLGGAIVARECLRRLDTEAIAVSELDLLDGLVRRMLRE